MSEINVTNVLKILENRDGVYPSYTSYQQFLSEQYKKLEELTVKAKEKDSDAYRNDYFDDLDLNLDEIDLNISSSRTLTPNSPDSPIEEIETGEVFYDITWLAKNCNKVSLTVALDSGLLFETVAKLIISNDSDQHIQNELIEWLGFDHMEFLSSIIQRRDQLRNFLLGQMNGVEPENSLQKQKQRAKELSNGNRGQFGAQVTIMTEAEKKELKQLRKEIKKNSQSKEKDSIIDASELRRIREDALNQRPSIIISDSFSKSKGHDYPNIYQAADTSNSSLSAFGSKFVLPKGTERYNCEFYDELVIPITTKAPPRTTEKTIFLSDMDSLCRNSFKGYKSLNRVQSIVYPIAYNTNENMLLCAPTGAGKTDVAMLAILRTLLLHCSPPPTSDNASDLRIHKSAFKIVYVAPMKALAAEIVVKMGSRLKWLGIQVRELTGDMQLSKAEILNTQIIVTTPEKWDVVTRKGTGDTELVQKIRLLIIDEVHLLHDSRGSVIESIVARTLRQVETTQSMIRIVGLSATLPNYLDVAQFLKVSPYQGLFYFDGGFRPVPLEQHFLGVRGKPGSNASNLNLDRACFEKTQALLAQGHQVMIFVHTRKETVRVIRTMLEMAAADGCMDLFTPNESNLEAHSQFSKDVSGSRNSELRQFYKNCVGMHNAGMLRSDRNLIEKMFAAGALRLLCCTATLAWGVNLPAYAVVIRGTQVYDSQKGSFVDLSILDVLQIFGRAGRPQYETHGVGYILTTGDKLSHYVSAITQQHPIESGFIGNLVDNLCAEICLGTVTTVDEAVTWLSYTFLYVRMKRNPTIYGVDYAEAQYDPLLGNRRRELIISAAKTLMDNQMIVFDVNTGYLTPKDLGRISSLYYLSNNSVEIMNNKMRQRMAEANVFNMVSSSKEFENIKVRDNEIVELNKMLKDNCACHLVNGINGPADKVNVLMQSYISKAYPEDFALVSDINYIAQNAGRILRAVFEIALNRNWGPTAAVLLSLCKSIERRMWSFEHPLCQFDLPLEIRAKLEGITHQVSIEELRAMSPSELGDMIRFARMGPVLAKKVSQFPTIDLEAEIFPITRTVLRVSVTITPDFEWDDKVHGHADYWWLWVEDTDQMELYHSESFILHKKTLNIPLQLTFTIPIVEPLPNQIFIRAISDRWIGAETLKPISFKHLILPKLLPQHTDLQNLRPLSVSALKDPVLEGICKQRFSHFNPVQTQVFYKLYHDKENVLLGAPTGSGKTMAAELAMWAAFRDNPNGKVVYVAPLKALVRERVADWRKRLTGPMNKTLVELTGDITPDLKTLERADIIITTPEKWDGISRGWHSRAYVRKVVLVIIDEIHLLGGDRGPILEVIVSRMNYISNHTKKTIRIVGLSTALANAVDLAGWLNISATGLFNFRHSVRPVPLEVYIDGFSGKHYCPRMASMNRPTYKAIRTHSPNQPVIVFVSSRRQTRLTAQDLIAYCGNEENPRQFLKMDEDDLEMVLAGVQDTSLKATLSFGIGLHHAGLVEGDRKLVEELFCNNKIQVLIATSTLAWGVNFPAHLVVVKGTEYYDAKTQGYLDYPVTDILQMMGRAGRPQFDTSGIARILVLDKKKNFFKKFLHEPFPVESSLHTCLDDHLLAEIVAKSVRSKQEAMDYLTWTYLYQRLRMNPSYYGMEDGEEVSVNKYLSALVDSTFDKLLDAGCIAPDAEGQSFDSVQPTRLGTIATFYYLSHQTIRSFYKSLKPDQDLLTILGILCDSTEYSEFAVRHNEDLVNQELERQLQLSIAPRAYDSPHAKALLLVLAHLSHHPLPSPDYVTDTGSVLDQAIRILQAMADIAAYLGYFDTLLTIGSALQALRQARWPDQSSLLTLPNITEVEQVAKLANSKFKIDHLAKLVYSTKKQQLDATRVLKLDAPQVNKFTNALQYLPQTILQLNGANSDNKLKVRIGVVNEIKCTLYVKRHTPYTGIACTPGLNKKQSEVVWVCLADSGTNRILSFKRVSLPEPHPTNKGTHQVKGGGEEMKLKVDLKFHAEPDFLKHGLVISVLNDCYLGLEFVVPVELEV